MRSEFGVRDRASRPVGGHQDGQSLAEFALMLPLLVMLAFGTVDFGRAMYAYVSVSSAAQAGAEYASRNLGATQQSVERAVKNESGSFLATAPLGSVVVTKDALTGGQITMMQVTVTYTFTPVTPFPFTFSVPISARAAAPAYAF